MISHDLYENMKNKYGNAASWAIWEKAGDKPMSNMGSLEIFNLEKKPNLLERLRNDVLMVGLNLSRPFAPTEPFRNFHDPRPEARDYKIRYAFENTEFYGAYMTDVIKFIEETDSKVLWKLLVNNPSIVKKNIDSFREEMFDLGAAKPIILAFGGKTSALLKRYLMEQEYSKLIKLTHYSHFIGKEDYKMKVEEQIRSEINPFNK